MSAQVRRISAPVRRISAPVPSTRARGRVDGLDVLRGVAVGLVMLRHAWPVPFAGAGVVGVVMFFALSGYLITGLLADEVAGTGRVDYRRFYLRRVRRLVPALLVLVAGVVVVTLTVDPLNDRDELGRTVLFALTWTGDLPFGHASDATFHLWTLALEEQFYLVWPAVFAVFAARGRARLALGLAGVACAAACVATVVWLHAEPDLAYSLPTPWAGCFVIGAAARLIGRRACPAAAAAPLALLALGVLSVVPLRGNTLTYLVGGPAIAALTAVLLRAWRTWTTVTHPAARALVWLGSVSYAAYLWNYPLTLWLRPVDPTGLLAIALTLGAAPLSWRWIESPLLHRARPAPVPVAGSA